jgi:glycosyltransferase involved in cell wall biosynthesis
MLYDFHISGMASWIYRLASCLRDEFEGHFIATRLPEIGRRFSEVGMAVYVPEESRALVSYLRRNRIDIVQYANSRFLGECALAAGVPVVVERTDGLRRGEALQPKDDLDAVIASTVGTVEPISRLIPRERIHVIYNGVDAPALDAVQPDRLGFGPEDVIIGRCSRFGRGKNIAMLIEAVRLLRAECPQAALVIVGGDSRLPGAERLEAELRGRAEPLGTRCLFTGHLEDPRAVIKAFDIGTCVSRGDNEGVPNSLLEPMAAGRPVVTTDTGDVRELVTDGVDGFVVPDDDVRGLAERLKRLVLDKALRERMGLAAREKILAKFDLRTQAERYRSLYRRLLAERRQGVALWARTLEYRVKHWRAFVPRPGFVREKAQGGHA